MSNVPGHNSGYGHRIKRALNREVKKMVETKFHIEVNFDHPSTYDPFYERIFSNIFENYTEIFSPYIFSQ